MSLIHTRETFVECPSCRAEPGSPELCPECLERRELHGVVESIREKVASGFPPLQQQLAEMLRICEHCRGERNPECPRHGR